MATRSAPGGGAAPRRTSPWECPGPAACALARSGPPRAAVSGDGPVWLRDLPDGRELRCATAVSAVAHRRESLHRAGVSNGGHGRQVSTLSGIAPPFRETRRPLAC